MDLPREFFIEDRLEKYRNTSLCNLGESGIRNFVLKDLLISLDCSIEELLNIDLKDSPNMGRWDLREEISGLYSGISPENILITTGTSEALFLLFSYCIKPGTKFTYLSPGFQGLYEIPEYLGGQGRGVEFQTSPEWRELFRDSNCVILNHPHNPTGLSIQEEDWIVLKSEILKFPGVVLFDEHYRFLDLESEIGVSGARLNHNCYATGSITKSFGVTGLRIGWIVGDVDVLNHLRSFKDYLTHTVNPISEFLALHILRNRSKLLPGIKNRIRANLKTFSDSAPHLNSLKKIQLPTSGLLFFPELNEGISSERYADELYKNCSVFVLPGSNFEKEGFIRIGLGEEESRFRLGIQRWVEWENSSNRFK